MINKNWVSWCWQLGVFGAMVAGAIASGFECALAQSKIVPDGTLGAESSVVTPRDAFGSRVDVIDGGVKSGANLFHSFREFNVSVGRGAYFYSPNVDIQNILARVTGSNRSEILGTIGTFGASNPNLFLINPNGIIFGQNARLDMGNAGPNVGGTGGSFVATTANAVLLGNNGIFSASEPAKSNLLSVNPSALLFNAISGQGIINSSQASAGVDANGDPITGLRVPNGRSLLLVGGDVQLDRGKLFVQDGRVELGGVSGTGTVGLNINGNYLSLSFPQQAQLADVSLTNGSLIKVPASDGGSTAINASNQDILGGINITARSFALTNGAQLDTRTDGQGNAGNITINARDSVSLNGGSVGSTVSKEAFGLGGNINITTGSLTVRNGAELDTVTYGQGNAGSITINARDIVSFDGGSVHSGVLEGAFGKGGNINITTGSLALTNSAQLVTTTFGRGNAGGITINARDIVSLDGVKVGSSVSKEAFGLGGNINITTGSLAFNNGALLTTGTSGRGDAGSITINARDRVTLDGNKSGVFSSNVFGKGGNINITTGSFGLTNGAQLSTATIGGGNAGSITINARDTVTLDGNSVVFSDVLPNVFGNGGNINITTGSLTVRNGARLDTNTFGQGNAGRITINARDTVTLDGVSSDRSLPSSISSGDVRLDNTTYGQGSAGSITTFDRVSSDGSLPSNVVGNGGNINISTGSLTVRNGAQLYTLDNTTYGQGSAGSITINARDTVTFDKSRAFSRVLEGAVGSGGNIDITTGSLALTNGGELDTTTYGRTKAGNVTINARDTVTFDGTYGNGTDRNRNPSGVFSAVDSKGVGSGGNIDISTGSLTVRNGAQLNANTDGQGDAGNVTINARDTVTFDGTDGNVGNVGSSGAFSQVNSTGVGKGGTIDITTGSFALTNGAQLSVRTNGQGNAGNVKINARNGSFTLTNGALLTSFTTAQGNAGSVTIDARDTLQLNNAQITTNSTSSNGGDITLTAKDIRLRNDSLIRTDLSRSQGSGGNITLTANTILALENSDILAFAPQGRGGNITFNTLAFLSDPLYRPSATTTEEANFESFKNNGRVDVNASGVVSGAITGVPDISFIQNSLSELPQNLIDPNVLIANSCIARSRKQQGTFTITGSGGLPNRPGDAVLSTYPTGDVRSVPGGAASHPWHKGDPIVEPQGVYHLTNGQLVLSRECSE